jgi:hypothetical protein
MPQMLLPLIPDGATNINNVVSVHQDKDCWTYFLSMYPIYSHKAGDQNMFKFVSSQLIDSRACRQVDIIKTFGVSKRSVIRALNKLKKAGVESFFKPRIGRCGGNILTPKVLEQAQSLLTQGYTKSKIADELGVKYDTVRKAISCGRLKEPLRCNVVKTATQVVVTTKSSRTVDDAAAAAGQGTACIRVEERILASVGLGEGAVTRFEASLDVTNGGVLCALPALLANGLLENAGQLLGKIKGYYTTVQILTLLSFMALCRIKTIEKFRGQPPGEFGKLIGLDRAPEVRCLREKMDALSAGNSAELWAAHLSRTWMNADPESVGTLYVDGHVRVYHGHLTKPPRRYVSRERLCLRGTTDYWVNDAIGRPFFMVEKVINPGLLKTLENDIVPRLLKDIPNQPSEDELKADSYLCRFILVFDREGYSPAFFCKMWVEYRVACMTYHKHPNNVWPENWFEKHEVTMPGGEVVDMRLAEMGSRIGSGKDAIWVREVRKLTDSGHQTSVISTAYNLLKPETAVKMFSRWCQENFFRYMMQHFAIDLLLEYGTVKFPDTEKVVNPAWRDSNRLRNSIQNKLRYRRACFAETTMHPEAEDDQKKYKKWLVKKSNLLEQIEQCEHQLTEIKNTLKITSKHITLGDLDEKDRFQQLLPERKRFMDTIRMIAYRAETSMVSLLMNPLIDSAAARCLLQNLYVTEADILPDPDNGILLVRVHNASTPAANRAIAQLFEQLNDAAIKYPCTNLCLKYELRGSLDQK